MDHRSSWPSMEEDAVQMSKELEVDDKDQKDEQVMQKKCDGLWDKFCDRKM